MKKPFLRYGDGKSPEALYPVRISGQVAYLCIPLSESGKDFMVAEAESALRSAIEARIQNPRVLATTVLEAWLKAARGSNGRGEVVEALAGYGITELKPPGKAPAAHRFISLLSDAIRWHAENTNDPYNIDNAAIAILSEVRDAWEKAQQ